MNKTDKESCDNYPRIAREDSDFSSCCNLDELKSKLDNDSMKYNDLKTLNAQTEIFSNYQDSFKIDYEFDNADKNDKVDPNHDNIESNYDSNVILNIEKTNDTNYARNQVMSESESLPNSQNEELTLVDDEKPSINISINTKIDYQNYPENFANLALIAENDDYEDKKCAQDNFDISSKQISNFVSSRRKSSKKGRKKRKKILLISLANCKYDSVRRVSKKFGFKEVDDDEDWNLYWTDCSVGLERVMDMKRYQKINHFPGMSEICRKDLLARNLNRLYKQFPSDYNIYPKTWCLPADAADLQAYSRQKKHKSYIIKPEMGSQGKGIWITKNIKDINLTEHCICQQYISKPLLIDDFKFDLRLYALVTSCDPLRIFVFNDGLGRFATCKYSEPSNTNVENIFMHLTNYAINKQNSNFVRDDEEGSKRRITTIMKYLKNKGYDTDKIWQNIYDVIIKTLIAAQAVLKHNYRTCFPNHVRGSACFEILGFDILIDKKLKPYLLEVNHSPSFHTDAKLDKEIKESLLFDTLRLNNFALLDKKKCVEEDRKRIKDRLFQKHVKKQDKNEIDIEMQKWYNDLEKFENAYCGNFTRIYPKNNVEKYESFFLNNVSLYQETAATKARSECARQQREEIIKKQKQSDAVFNRSSNNSVLIKKKYARGESPYFLGQTSVKKKPRKSSQKSTSRSNSEQRKNYIVSNCNKMFDIKDTFNQPIDINKPMNIIESEELERINNMLQRDNLVRNMGIVEHVYKILHLRKTYYMRKIGEKKNLKINNKTESAPQNQIYANHFVNLTNSYGILNAQKKTSNVNLKLVSNDQNEYTAKVKKLSNMIYSDINIFLPKKQQGSNSNILKFKNTEKTKLITTNANQPNLNLVKNISKLTLPSIAKCSILHPSAHFPCSSKLQKCLSIVSAVADSTSYETMRESNSKNYEYINKI